MSNAFGTIILLAYCSFLILQGVDSGGIEVGTFVTFAFFLNMFWEPISRLGQMYNQLLVAMASSERIFEFLDEQPNVKEKEDAGSFDQMEGIIEFDHVKFSYDNERIALNDISRSEERRVGKECRTCG